jgi:glycosyltransferase involved in cell wall biosynthesis
LSKKVLISINTAWNLFNFRSGLIQALISAGYEVVAVAPKDEYSEYLELLGCRFVNIKIDNKGTSVQRDLFLLFQYTVLLIKEKPSVCLFYTVKPNIYGSLASMFCNVPYVNNISGLGAVFIKGGWLERLISFLYKLSLMKSAKVFFQNNDDLQLFSEKKIVNPGITDVLPGSGINLRKFKPLSVDLNSDKNYSFHFLLIARMLKDKGVIEYVNAAQILKTSGFNVKCCLLGFLDVQNPAAISSAQMEKFVEQGFVHYLGTSDDVREHISRADCVVLPSYREGTPRSLLEAAAMAKPIITTNVIGCKNVVDDGVNGFVCEPKNSTDLALKMKSMILLSNEDRQIMGRNGRLKMEKEFDESIVIQKYLHTIGIELKVQS